MLNLAKMATSMVYQQFKLSPDPDIATKFEDWIEGLEALIQVGLKDREGDDKEKKFHMLFHYMGPECRKIFKRLDNNGQATKDYK